MYFLNDWLDSFTKKLKEKYRVKLKAFYAVSFYFFGEFNYFVFVKIYI